MKDIIDTLDAAGNFTVLGQALATADLVTTFKRTGPYTVFAPTDDAFAAAITNLGTTREKLLHRVDLKAIITYCAVKKVFCKNYVRKR